MPVLLYIGLPLTGLILGWIIRWLYARFQLSASEQRAERVKQDAIKEAEAQKKEILLEAKDQLIRERNQLLPSFPRSKGMAPLLALFILYVLFLLFSSLHCNADSIFPENIFITI